MAVIDSEEAIFLSIINSNRSASTQAWDSFRGQWVTIPKGTLQPLSLSQSLTVASELHSYDMAAHNNFGHNGTDGRTPDHRMYDAGYIHAYNTYLGENIAAGFTTAVSVFNSWYGSEKHREILLCMQYNAIGIDRAYNASSNYGWYWTVAFGGYDDSGKFDFSVGVNPAVASVIQGGGAKANVTVTLLNGTTQPVSLSTSVSPATTMISLSLSSTSGAPEFASQLTVLTTNSTPPGTYTITIFGVGGSLNRSASFNLTITSPNTHRVTFQASGLGGDATSTILVVDGVKYSQLPMTFQWSSGSVHTYNWSSLVSATSGKRYGWAAASGLLTSQYGSITASSNGTVTASYKTQYYLTMTASNGGTVSPSSGWCDNGLQIAINAVANTGHSFMNWTGTGLGSYSGTSETAKITISGPIIETANFQPQQLLSGQLIAPPNGVYLTTSPVKLCAKVTYGESAVPGATVQFYVDDIDVGTTSTNSTGYTTLSYYPSAGTHAWYTVVNWLVYNAKSDIWGFTYTPTKTLLVSVSTYKVKSTVRCQIYVTDSTTGKGVAGATVKVTLIKPNGMSTTTTKVTDASGNVYISYRMNRKSLTGTYTIWADASASGYGQASGSTSFKVG